MTPYGFDEDETFMDSSKLSEALWQEWLNTILYLIAKEIQLDDILYGEVFNRLTKEKQSALIGRKANLRKRLG